MKREISQNRRFIIKTLVPIYFIIISGAPIIILSIFINYLSTPILYYLSPLLILLYFIFYASFAIILSKLTKNKSISGKFPRDLGHNIYGPRRLYSFCWTSIYYFTPLYHLILSWPLFKKVVLRGFGYNGSIDITLYPDTWLRDINLLNIESDVYLSNRSTIGTNMCLKDGSIIVFPITLKKGVMIGHLAMIGPGVIVENNVEISVGCSIGIKTKIGERSKIGPCCAIHHGVRIGSDVEIGAHVYIGSSVIIGNGLKIPNGAIIPTGAIIRRQEDLNSFISSETNINDHST
jgi:UDP-3-O-[3-hydroxymyristoyl] glucosamine N-acyltransferase